MRRLPTYVKISNQFKSLKPSDHFEAFEPQQAEAEIERLKELGYGGLKSSGHETEIVIEEATGLPYVFKTFAHPVLPQIEAGMAALYALAEPDRIAEVHAVYNRKAVGSDVKDSAVKIDHIADHPIGSVSKMFPHFVDLETFFTNDCVIIDDNPVFDSSTPDFALAKLTHERKMKYLVDHGLAEVCALSYFFQEDDLTKRNLAIVHGRVVRIDFDMSAFSIVGQPDLRGKRTGDSLVRRQPEELFPITGHDLWIYPILRDADPNYWITVSRTSMSSNAYSHDELLAFRKLEENFEFIDKSYLTFLELILTPDDAIKENLKAHVEDPVYLDRLQALFIRRKIELRKAMFNETPGRDPVKVDKVKNWWKAYSTTPKKAAELQKKVQAIFAKFVEHTRLHTQAYPNLCVNMSQAAHAYHLFCVEIAKETVEKSLVELSELKTLCRTQIKSIASGCHASELFTPLVALQSALHRSYHKFFEIAEPTQEEIDIYIFETENALRAVEERHCYADSIQINKLNEFLDMLRCGLRQLSYHRYSNADHAVDEQRSVVAPKMQSDMESCVFVPTPKMANERLVAEAFKWLCQSRNLITVRDIYQRTLDAYRKQVEGGVSATVVAAVSNVSSAFFSYIPSWSLTTKSSAAVVANPSSHSVTDLDQIYMTLADSHCETDLCKTLSRLFSVGELTPDSFNVQFVSALLNQFSREFSAKHILRQIVQNPRLVARMKERQTGEEIITREIVELFIKAIQPTSDTFQVEGAGDWEGIEHISGTLTDAADYVSADFNFLTQRRFASEPATAVAEPQAQEQQAPEQFRFQ